jgi:predicted MFS family arabinose efflux permease
VAFQALRHRNFRLYLAGQAVSLVGTWLQSVAQSWLVYRLTDSPLLLGLAGFAGQAPVFFLAVVGGTLADRVDKRRLLVGTQAASAACAAALAVLTLSGRVTIVQVFVIAAALGAVNAFDIPTRQAFVAEMVGRDDLPNAIALNSSAVNAARIAGPALAGILVGLVGEGWCFAINAASFGTVILALLTMRLGPRTARRQGGSAASEIREAAAFALAHSPIRDLLLLLGVVSLVGMPYAVLMPVFADRVLGGGAETMGVLLGAAGVGALAAALALAVRASPRGLGRWVAGSAVGFGVALVAFSLARGLAPACLALLVAGFCLMTQMAASNTLLQVLTPDRLRGRIMAFYSMMFMGMAPFGALGAGAAAARLGAPLTVALGGLVSIAGGGLLAGRLPALRAGARQLLAAHEVVAGEPSGAATPAEVIRRVPPETGSV